jgi:hypothetical protein
VIEGGPRRLLAMALIAVAAALAIAFLFHRRNQALSSQDSGRSEHAQPRAGTGNTLPMAIKTTPSQRPPGSLGDFTAAEARAYAWLGQVKDGVIASLPELDEETTSALPRMREYIEQDAPKVGEGKMIATSTGTFSIARRPGQKASPLPPVEGLKPEEVAQKNPDRVELVPHPGDIALTKEGQVITGAGVWAGISLQPDQNRVVRILDRGEGGYVFTIHAKDAGSVRVNGGLIVPGRYYVIRDQVEIVSDAPIGIDICPLSASVDYFPSPLPPPKANA